ncbi:hypothetical protein ACFE04_014632 [Oxalis oulophora]
MEEGLVIGFRFLPTDQELLECLLYNRVTTGVPLLDCPNVYEDDFYGKSTEVLEIWNKFGGPQLERNSVGMEGDLDLFVFTHLLKKATSRKKFIRTVGTGCWEGENSSEPVFGADGSVLGSKKRFKYSNKKNSQVDGLWSMIEFSLAGSYFLEQNPNISTDLVLCRIRKGKTSTKKRKFQDIITQRGELPTSQSTGNNNIGMMLEAPNLGNEAAVPMSQQMIQSTTYHQDNLFSNINESTSTFQAPISQQIDETLTTQWTTYDQDSLFDNINESTTFQAPISTQQINNETFTTQSTSTNDQDDILLNITEDDIEQLKQALNWTSTENSMVQGGELITNNDEQAAKSSNELAFATTQWTRNDDHHNQGDSSLISIHTDIDIIDHQVPMSSNDIFATQSTYDDMLDIPPEWQYML